MKAFAMVQGPHRKVISVAKDAWWARYLAASQLDYESICGITGSQNNVSRVLREHGTKLVRIDFQFAEQRSAS